MADFDMLALFRLSHVLFGVTGIGLFWVPIFAPKGGRLHVKSGRLFTYCAYYGGGTGLLLSLWALAHPPSFFGDSAMRQIDERDLPYALESARFLYSITGFLALAVLTGTFFGIRVVKTRRDHARLRSPVLLAVLGAFGLWSIGLAGYGLWSLIACYAGWHLLPPAAADRYWINAVLGVIGIYGVIGDLRYVHRPSPTPMAWWYQHMECMLGAGIGFHAAAFFFIAKEFLNLRLEGAWQLAPMLLPLVIGVPAMWVWIAHYERKFEGDGNTGTLDGQE